MIDYKKDGIDHINIYSKAKTPLGKFLSNFAHAEIETEDGEFVSVEGYWYWLLCGNETKTVTRERESLRLVFGYDAKNLGRKILEAHGPATIADGKLVTLDEKKVDSEPDFQRKIKAAIKFKIENNPKYKTELAKCTLPFEHYYVFYGKVKEPSSHHWIIEYIDELRKEYGKMSSLQA